MNDKKYSVVIPAYNEEGAIGQVITSLQKLKSASIGEIIIVDDCSTDGTYKEAEKYKVKLLKNVQNSGYGYSLKKGINNSIFDNIIILDADGSYPVSELNKLIHEYEKGFDMVVGQRQGFHYHGSMLKRIARICFRYLSEFATGRKIPDINSGYRIFKKDVALKFFHTLSSGFSFTTTITLAFMLNSYSVHYVPIKYEKRNGSSKVRYLRDTLRAGQIIVESIVIYNPLKLFLLLSAIVFIFGILSLILSIFMSKYVVSVLFITVSFSVLVFALGLVTTFLKFTKK